MPDGDCRYAGCMDSRRSNFNPSAGYDDGSFCVRPHPGCTDSTALNYFSGYTEEDGSCSIAGCLDRASPHYNSKATFDWPSACEGPTTAPTAAPTTAPTGESTGRRRAVEEEEAGGAEALDASDHLGPRYRREQEAAMAAALEAAVATAEAAAATAAAAPTPVGREGGGGVVDTSMGGDATSEDGSRTASPLRTPHRELGHLGTDRGAFSDWDQYQNWYNWNSGDGHCDAGGSSPPFEVFGEPGPPWDPTWPSPPPPFVADPSAAMTCCYKNECCPQAWLDVRGALPATPQRLTNPMVLGGPTEFPWSYSTRKDEPERREPFIKRGWFQSERAFTSGSYRPMFGRKVGRTHQYVLPNWGRGEDHWSPFGCHRGAPREDTPLRNTSLPSFCNTPKGPWNSTEVNPDDPLVCNHTKFYILHEVRGDRIEIAP